MHTATLDQYCENNAQCNEIGLTCLNKKCQCEVPWFKPCNSSCEVIPNIAYQGEVCKTEENCVPNTQCANGICQCKSGFESKNGLCFKPLNSNCENKDECWSNNCTLKQCQCPPNTKPIDSTTCQKQLVDVYNNWAEANAEKAFCFDSTWCSDSLAICEADSGHPQDKFCQCPNNYHIEDKTCIPIKGQYLSPLESKPDDYGKCGYCEDVNAECIAAAGQTTCWCRSGYKKNEDKCEKHDPKPKIIFPNQRDVQEHAFTNSCSGESVNGLCVCSSGYEFVANNQPCKPYNREWINEIYEYGLCTQINSIDEAIPQKTLCPEPLTCIEKNDKHVCSCGKDQFRDLTNTSQCVYYIGKGAGFSNATCPENAQKNALNDNCQCRFGYKATDDYRQCELKLSPSTFPSSECQNPTQNHSVCTSIFGDKAVLCNLGECRCQSNDSAADDKKTRCYAKVNTTLYSPYAPCPLNANFNIDRCLCNAGFSSSDDLRTCVPMNLTLVANQGDASLPSNRHNTIDCQALFTGPVEFYKNNDCRCLNTSFINDYKTGCLYKLNTFLPNPKNETYCPPNSAFYGQDKCECKSEYRQENEFKCVLLQDRLYDDDDRSAPNITGITNSFCIFQFGYASEKSQKGDYCTCKSNAYAVNKNKSCHFPINFNVSGIIDPSTCPENSHVSSSAQTYVCVCKSGYQVSANNRTCEKIKIELIGSKERPANGQTNCSQISTADCQGLFGVNAFCEYEKCYCDRRLSFKNDQDQCENLFGFIFPGEQQLDIYSCQSNADCGDAKHVVCEYWYGNKNFKVCQCEDGVFLDPKTQTCVDNRCLNCDQEANFECRNDICQCKPGYYLKDSRCVAYTDKLQLHQICNSSTNGKVFEDQTLVCDSNCNRVVCTANYMIENSKCVPYQLDNFQCFYQSNLCKQIDTHSNCNRDENKCLCQSNYKLFENRCATPVDSPCIRDDACDFGMQCKGKKCACLEGQYVEEIRDSNGQKIKACMNATIINSGVNHLHYQPILLLLFSLIHLFFF